MRFGKNLMVFLFLGSVALSQGGTCPDDTEVDLCDPVVTTKNDGSDGSDGDVEASHASSPWTSGLAFALAAVATTVPSEVYLGMD